MSEAAVRAPFLEPSAFRRAVRLFTATARKNVLEYASRPIMLIRAPLSPVLFLLSYLMAYRISGQTTVNGANALGFLYLGVVAIDAWNSTVWGSGYAFQHERDLQTIGAVMLAPISRPAFVLGHGVATFVFWGVPSQLLGFTVAVLLGARFSIHHPIAVLVSFLTVYIASLAIGFGFSALFILSRQANMLANFLQTPIYLLAGFLVPRSVLPDWLYPVTNVLPIAHALDALRATALTGAGFSDIWRSLAAWIGGCVGFFIIGLWGLRRVDRVSRRLGTLDLAD